MNIELAVDIASVDLDSIQREVEPLGDLPIGQPVGDQVQHFHFAIAEGFNQWRSGI